MFSHGMISNIYLIKSRGLLCVVLTAVLLTLSSCSSARQTFLAQPEISLPLPMPVVMHDVKFTTCKIDEQMYLALDGQNYENLAHNMAEMIRWTKEAMWRITVEKNKIPN